jgi:hypothetical protein
MNMAIDRLKDASRRQHYYFAHNFLRDRVFEHPKLFVDKHREELGTKYLSFLWLIVGETSKADEDDFIPPDGLRCFPIDIGDEYYGLLVQFPTPKKMTEAYFVAIILPVDADDSMPCNFFTLEFTINNDGSEGTVVGEWNSRGSHFSLAAKSAPEKEAFVETVRRLMLDRPRGLDDKPKGRGTKFYI